MHALEKMSLISKGIERQDESLIVQREALSLLRETRDLQKEQNAMLQNFIDAVQSRPRASSMSIPDRATTPPPPPRSTPTSPQRPVRRFRRNVGGDIENIAP